MATIAEKKLRHKEKIISKLFLNEISQPWLKSFKDSRLPNVWFCAERKSTMADTTGHSLTMRI